MGDMPWRTLHRLSRTTVERKLDLSVEGLEHLPESGPVIVAARHVHHLYDGAAILASIPRPAHIVVGLDWIESPIVHATLPRLCRAARWPIVYRATPAHPIPAGQRTAALRIATRDVLALLSEGRVVVMFPEGYPNIDPGYTPKSGDVEMLPFAAGVVRFAALAARSGINVPIVPVGFCYAPGRRWQVRMRIENAQFVRHRREEASVLAALEGTVRSLS
jgi:putative membrane protein